MPAALYTDSTIAAVCTGETPVLTSRSVIGRDLEQDFRDRLTALRSETEQESEALLQHIERERGALQEELQLLRAQEAELQEELCNAVQVCYTASPLSCLVTGPDQEEQFVIRSVIENQRREALSASCRFRRTVVWRRS